MQKKILYFIRTSVKLGSQSPSCPAAKIEILATRQRSMARRGNATHCEPSLTLIPHVARYMFVQFFVVTYVHTKFAFITCMAIFLSRHIWSSVTALHALFSLSISTAYEGGKNYMTRKKNIDVDVIFAR